MTRGGAGRKQSLKYAEATLNKPKQLAAILKDKDSDQGITDKCTKVAIL